MTPIIYQWLPFALLLPFSTTLMFLVLESSDKMQTKYCLFCLRETFSFVLTNVDGSRKIGYCRRLLVCASS